MNSLSIETPVVLIAFNRPDTTRQVLDAVRKVRPKRLFLVADGPRSGYASDQDLCDETREILSQVDWDCEVSRRYSSDNKGLTRSVGEGLSWVFSQCHRAIVLEDDCVANSSFFRFCDELLARYQDDERIMSISGNNHIDNRARFSHSYYFSRYCHVWGWATWARAWRHYDASLERWPYALENGLLADILGSQRAVDYWTYTLSNNARTRHTWDYSWLFSCWMQNGLSIIPRVNLVTNVGFGAQATHTKCEQDPLANMPSLELAFPLHHPDWVVRDSRADAVVEQKMFGGTLDPAFQHIASEIRRRRGRS